MAPRIRFLRATAGHRLAYATDGVGPTLVLPAWWVSHVERDFADPAFHRFFTRLAERFTVVRYDRLGTGLSDRERTVFTLGQEVADLAALIDELGVERMSLLGVSCGGPTAVAYAARHPRRIDRLVLFGSYAHGEALGKADVRAALVALVRASWGVGAKALSDIFTPEATAEEARRFAAAARLPGAMFRPLEGISHPPWQGDSEAALRAIFAFAEGEERVERAGATAGEPELRRDGDVWTVRYADRTGHLKHARGLSDLATLISRPGQAFHVLELMAGGSPEAPAALGADPALDERAGAEYRGRLAEIDEALSLAVAASRPGRAAELEAERDALLHELRSATGMGGRRRALGDTKERARKAVSGRIRESIERLREAHPELARHLEATVATGTFCSYDPDRRREQGGEPEHASR